MRNAALPKPLFVPVLTKYLVSLIYSAIILALSTLIMRPLLAAAEPGTVEVGRFIPSVLLLTSPGNNACATGFILPNGLVLTNAHVARALCPFGACEDVSAFRAGAIGELPKQKLASQGITIRTVIPALDVAFLDMHSSEPLTGVFAQTAPPAIQTEVHSLGFPKCGALSVSDGKILSQGTLNFGTSLSGAHGSSGSPVFNAQGDLLGIVAESDSISGGLLSLISDYKFEAVAMRADRALALGTSDPRALLEKQSDLLLEHYRTGLRLMPAFQRSRAAVSFIGAVEALKDEIIFASEFPERVAFLPLGQSARYISEVEITPSTSLMRSLATLVLAYNLEVKGPFLTPLQRLNVDSLFEALNKRGLPSDLLGEWKDLLMTSAASSYPGLELYGMTIVAEILIIAVIVVGALMLSAGYVYGRLRGSRLKRFLWSAACFIIWPIPLFVALRQRRS